MQLVAFLYTNAKRGIKKTIPFTIASETMKYLGISLTKEIKSLYIEHYRHWWNKLKKKTQLSRKILYLLIRRINIIKVSTQHKVIYGFDAIPIQIPMEVFHRNRKKKKILNSYGAIKDPK